MECGWRLPGRRRRSLQGGWGVDHYDLGKGFGHIAIEVDDVYAACAEIKRRGGTVVREAGPMNAGATVTDPDGYYIELIGQRG